MTEALVLLEEEELEEVTAHAEELIVEGPGRLHHAQTRVRGGE